MRIKQESNSEKVASIGERNLIFHLSKIFKPSKPSSFLGEEFKVLKGAGSDDCAVLELDEEICLVATTDMLHRTTDFPEGMTPWQMGWMAAAVNLSDIASMGAFPIGLLMAIGMPADTEVAFVEELAKGMQACAEFCETSVLGGDIDTHEELTITGTALGKAKKSELLFRCGAKPGELVCVTGATGSAGAALDALLKQKKASKKLLKSLLEPVPRIKEARKLAARGLVSSMMDTSDGLALSLHELAKASQVGFSIQEAALPVEAEVLNFASDPEELLNLSLYTGGDFELLFTIKPENLQKVQNICKVSVIGKTIVKEEGILLKRSKGKRVQIAKKGYLQFEPPET
ncbi:MAG: thiamine-phosphate kinase [Methanosarcinaceae archaeon]|nr:thiamine-phosphate kinase [Methanosarcinaceae archaeon]MDD4331963.1 thiamine-phosphate kinase [Methanosarcinaceae archaeon]